MAHPASSHAGKSLSHRMASSNGQKKEGQMSTSDRQGLFTFLRSFVASSLSLLVTSKDTSIPIDPSSSDDDDEPIRAPLQLKIEVEPSIA